MFVGIFFSILLGVGAYVFVLCFEGFRLGFVRIEKGRGVGSFCVTGFWLERGGCFGRDGVFGSI